MNNSDAYDSVCIKGKKCLFFGKFGVLCLLEKPVFRFAILLYYRPIMSIKVFEF